MISDPDPEKGCDTWLRTHDLSWGPISTLNTMEIRAVKRAAISPSRAGSRS